MVAKLDDQLDLCTAVEAAEAVATMAVWQVGTWQVGSGVQCAGCASVLAWSREVGRLPTPHAEAKAGQGSSLARSPPGGCTERGVVKGSDQRDRWCGNGHVRARETRVGARHAASGVRKYA